MSCMYPTWGKIPKIWQLNENKDLKKGKMRGEEMVMSKWKKNICAYTHTHIYKDIRKISHKYKIKKI